MNEQLEAGSSVVGEANLKKQNIRCLLVLITCCGMLSASMGLCVNSYGVFFTPICETLGVGRGAITLHSTISGIITGLMAPVIVKILKKVHIRWVTFTGILMVSLSFVAMYFADKVWMFNVLGFVRGFGGSCFYMPVVTVIVGNWIRKNQGAIIGFVMAFTGISGAILSPVLTASIQNYGYQVTALFCAVFVLVVAAPGALFFVELKPEDIGMEPYGLREIRAKENAKVNGGTVLTTDSETEVVSGLATASESASASAKRLVNPLSYKSASFLLIAIYATASAGSTGLTFHLSGYAENIGAGTVVGGMIISAALVGNILSKLISGVLTDKIGPTITFTIMSFVSICGLSIFLIEPQATDVLLIGGVLFGFVYCVSTTGLNAFVRMVFGNKQYGEAYSAASLPCSIALALVLSCAGTMYDVFGNYRLAMMGVVLLNAVSFVCAILIKNVSAKHNTFEDE